MKKRSANPQKIYLNKNLQVLFSVTLISIMGVASLTPAFPEIRDAFGISAGEVALLVTVFTLPGIILTPLLGVFSDIYGRKTILVPSLILFGLAGGACFLVRDFTLLVAFRFIQGIAAAPLGSLNVTLIGDIFSGRDRSAAMGHNAAVLSVGTASYPIIGGALATLAWFYPFALTLLAFPVALLVALLLNNPKIKNEKGIGEYFRTIVVCLKSRQLIGIFLLSVLTFIILYGPYLTYFPFLLRDVFSQPPYIIGVIMSVSSFSSFMASNQMGRLVVIFSERKLIIISCFFYIASMALVPFVDSVWLLVIPALMFGLAQGLNLPSLLTLLSKMAPPEQRGAIMSLNGMLLRLGQTLGPVIIVPVFAVWGLEGAFVLGSLTGVIMLATALLSLMKK